MAPRASLVDDRSQPRFSTLPNNWKMQPRISFSWSLKSYILQEGVNRRLKMIFLDIYENLCLLLTACILEW